MNNERFLILLMFAITIYFSLLMSVNSHEHNLGEANAADIYLLDDNQKVVERFNASDLLFSVPISCDSQSMGLSLNCKDSLFTELVTENSMLIEGDIYIYTKNEKIIVHRLVKCLDDQCNRSIFKGDNNYVADDIVEKSKIFARVYGLEFAGK